MDRWGWASNLASGSSLALLYSLEATGGGWGSVIMVLLGGLMALVAQRMFPLAQEKGPKGKGGDPVGDCARLGSSMAEICLTGAAVFSQAGRVDSDVGAALCAIPLFHAVCMHGTSDPQYSRYTKGLVAFLGLGVLSYGTFVAFNDSGATSPALTMPEGVVSALTLLNAAYACSGGTATSIAARASVFASLAAQPWALAPLLRLKQGWVLFAMQMVMLVHSMLVQAGEARSAITSIRAAMSADEGGRISRAQRSLMLCMAPTLTLSFAFQWRSWVDGLWAVAGVQACWACLWAYKRQQ